MDCGCCVVRASLAPSPAAALAGDPDPSAAVHPSSPEETPSWSRGPSALAFSPQASRKTKKKEGGALRAQRASSNVFSNFEQTQIQEFKEVRDPLPISSSQGSPGNHMQVTERAHQCLTPGPVRGAAILMWLGQAVTLGLLQAFTLMDQNRDGFIDKEDLKDTYASLGQCRGGGGG